MGFFLAQVGIAEFLVGVSSSQVTAFSTPSCESMTFFAASVCDGFRWGVVFLCVSI